MTHPSGSKKKPATPPPAETIVLPQHMYPLAILPDGRLVAHQNVHKDLGKLAESDWCAQSRLLVGDPRDMAHAAVVAHRRPARSLENIALHPSGRLLAIAYDGTLAVIDLEHGKDLWQWSDAGCKKTHGTAWDTPDGLSWNEQGDLVVVMAGYDAIVWTFSPTGEPAVRMKAVPFDQLLDGRVIGNTYVASCNAELWGFDLDSHAETWRLDRTEAAQERHPEITDDWYNVVGLHPLSDGRIAVVGDNGVMVVRALDGTVVHLAPLPAAAKKCHVAAAALSPDGAQLALQAASGPDQIKTFRYDLAKGSYHALPAFPGWKVDRLCWTAGALWGWHEQSYYFGEAVELIRQDAPA